MPEGEEEGGRESGTDSEIRRASVVSFPFFIGSLFGGKAPQFFGSISFLVLAGGLRSKNKEASAVPCGEAPLTQTDGFSTSSLDSFLFVGPPLGKRGFRRSFSHSFSPPPQEDNFPPRSRKHGNSRSGGRR